MSVKKLTFSGFPISQYLNAYLNVLHHNCSQVACQICGGISW